jgi:hypothetical protein
MLVCFVSMALPYTTSNLVTEVREQIVTDLGSPAGSAFERAGLKF